MQMLLFDIFQNLSRSTFVLAVFKSLESIQNYQDRALIVVHRRLRPHRRCPYALPLAPYRSALRFRLRSSLRFEQRALKKLGRRDE